MQVELTEEEALVLFDLLSSYGVTDDGRTLVVRHAAERNALWALLAQLEKQLEAPLQANYEHTLSAAQASVEEQAVLGRGPRAPPTPTEPRPALEEVRARRSWSRSLVQADRTSRLRSLRFLCRPHALPHAAERR